MKKSTAKPNLPMSSRMQMPGGGDKTSSLMADKSAMKSKSASKKMTGASKKGMPAKKGY
jgi:hypothetical protein